MSDHKAILDEHKELGILLRDLRAVSHWESGLLRESHVRQQLARDLQSLRIRLQQHFSTEESGAYLAEITRRMPSAREALAALHSQHGMLLEQISFLENACLGPDQGAGAAPALVQKLIQVLDMLKLHERSETALIQEVFLS